MYPQIVEDRIVCAQTAKRMFSVTPWSWSNLYSSVAILYAPAAAHKMFYLLYQQRPSFLCFPASDRIRKQRVGCLDRNM